MSKVIAFQIPKSQKEFIRFQQDRGAHFYDKLHQHPQLQLTVILEGSGQFLSGDYMGRFQPGDVFFLGENVPHVFRSDAEYFADDSILKIAGDTLFYDFQAFGDSIWEVEDLQGLKSFLPPKGSCFQIFGETQVRVQELFKEYQFSKNLFRFQKGMEILAVLEKGSDDFISLNKTEGLVGLSEKDGSRMDQILRYLLDNRFRAISLDEISEQANMSKEAFCRFFKMRTRKTFTQYVNQLRISEAQKLLKESDKNVSEIAFSIGYENLSHFNRNFKVITGKTPIEFRKSQMI